MEGGDAKKRRGSPRKGGVVVLDPDDEEAVPLRPSLRKDNGSRVAVGSGVADMEGSQRVTRQNPGGRRALADLEANTVTTRARGRATRRKPVAVKQEEKQAPRVQECRKDAPSEPSVGIRKSPTPAIPRRGKARRVALARRDAEAAGENGGGKEGEAACGKQEEAEETGEKIGSEGKAAFRRGPLPEVPGLPSDYEARLEVVRRVCQTINAEVQARCEALKATVDMQLPAVMAQLKLQQSKLSAEQLAMPLDKFVQKYCSHSRIVEREDGSFAVVRNEGVAVEHVKACVDGGLAKAPGQPTPGGAGLNVAAGEANFSSASKWLLRGQRRDKERDLGEIMSAYVQASASHDFSLTSPTTATPAVWGRSHLFSAPLSAPRQPQGYGVTPRSERRPQRGEMLMSINGSPLGHYV